MNPKYFNYKAGLVLESGQLLEDITIAYHTYGEYNPQKNNVIWVCHALTANSDVFDWWAGLFGEDDFFNDRFWHKNVLDKPAMNVKEIDDYYLVELAAPELTKKDFEITIYNGYLKIFVEFHLL